MMASIKQMETKDGRRFFQICVSRGYGKAPYKTRWYWPDGWSKRTAEREAAKQAAAFELACKNGEVLNRAQEREKAAREAAEAAKLKTVRQYADGVFMPTKEATFSENARSSYRMFLDKHILPVLGDVPVSYTHLDVYKRQAPRRSQCRSRFLCTSHTGWSTWS